MYACVIADILERCVVGVCNACMWVAAVVLVGGWVGVWAGGCM